MNGNDDSDKGKPRINKKEWVEQLNEIKLAKSDLNKLIMNFFLIEGSISNSFWNCLGYRDAAENFKKESGTDSKWDINSQLKF